MNNSAYHRTGVRFFPFYYGWAIVAAAFIETALTAGISNSQGVFLKPLLVEFGWTRAMVAGAFALSNIVAAGLATFMGAMADRYGPRLMIALDGLFIGGAYLLTAGIKALWQFYGAFGVAMAIGKSAAWGSQGPTISRWFSERRGLAQGIVQSGAGLGTVIFPPLATYLILTHNWRFAYVVLGLLLIGLVGGTSIIYRRRPEDMGLKPDGRPTANGEFAEATKPVASRLTGRKTEASQPAAANQDQGGLTLRQALSTRAFRFVAISMVASSFAQQLILVHLVPHATDIGFSPAVAATFMSVLGIANIVGKITMGIVSDRIGRRNSLIISFSLAACMLFWLMFARNMWSLYLFAAFYGFAYGSWIPMFPAIASDLFGLGALGAIFGTLAASNSLGGALGAFAGGYIFDVTQSYSAAFVGAAALLMAGIGFLSRLRLPGKPGQAKAAD